MREYRYKVDFYTGEVAYVTACGRREAAILAQAKQPRRQGSRNE